MTEPRSTEEEDRATLYDRDGDGKLWWPVGYVPLWLRRHQESLSGTKPND